jgi:putative ABC transport system permease protein
LTRAVTVAALRGPLQLLAVGYVITAIFNLESAWPVFGLLAAMWIVASTTAGSRLSMKLAGSRLLIGGSLLLGTSLGLCVLSQGVLSLDPWYDPQYWIPFAGMLLGNAMNATSIAGERFQEELSRERSQIEAHLALGFSARESTQPLLARSMRAALIPMTNNLTVAGVVQLPGMMTGQILSGTPPIIAVKYQMVIFFLLFLTIAVSSLCFLLLLQRSYFTRAHQLRLELLR